MNSNQYISSKQNPIIKSITQIIKNKGDANKFAILEGIHLCQEWLLNKGMPYKAFFSINKLDTSDELKKLFSKLSKNITYTLEDSLLKNVSNIAYAQGVFFVVEIKNKNNLTQIIENCLILDHIQDPGNVGTIIRTAAGAGIKNVYLTVGCANPWSLKALRSTQGAIFGLNVFNNCDVQHLIKILDIPLIVTELDSTAKNLYEFKIPNPVAWAFGNEGSGVSKILSDYANHKVFIPQDTAIESLNVASAAAICLFEQRRQILYESTI